MPRFAANLSMMYGEFSFAERFGAAAKDGFQAVEYLFPYEFQAASLRELLDQHGLQQILFNAPPGDWAGGERGIASLPGREQEFRDGFERALDYAKVLGNRYIHVMAGLLTDQRERGRHHAVYLRNLADASLRASREGIQVLIEPINTRDMPGYFLSSQAQARQIRSELGIDDLLIQFDIYHCQIMEGDISKRLQQGLAAGEIAHVQIAGVPDRHEPSEGELNYPYLFNLLDQADYQGWIGCEYRPRGATSAGLEWLRPYLNRQA